MWCAYDPVLLPQGKFSVVVMSSTLELLGTVLSRAGVSSHQSVLIHYLLGPIVFSVKRAHGAVLNFMYVFNLCTGNPFGVVR